MLFLLLIVAAIVAGVVVFFRTRGAGFRWDLLFSTLRSIDPWWLTACILLILLSYVGRVLRWRIMIRGVREHASVWNLLSATLIGFTAIVFFGRPGEFVRPYLIARKENVSFSSQMAAWVIERIYDLLLVLLLFGFALTQVNPHAQIGPNLRMVLRTGGYVAAALGVFSVAVLFVTATFSDLAQAWMRRLTGLLPHRFGAVVQSMFQSFAAGMSFAGTPKVIVELILFSVAEWVIILGSMYCLLQAYPATAHLTLVDTLVFAGFVAFGAAVQVPGIGGGLQVAAFVVLTELFGLAVETATGMALFLWAATWLVVVPFGVLCAFHEGIQWGNLRHVDEEMRETQPSR